MKRIYVTECGYFDEYGHFRSDGVIGVDTMLRNAVSYPLSLGCYRHNVVIDDLSMIVIYKCDYSNKGYRLTVHDAF